MKIGMLGLGKLGLPVTLAIESKGHEVYGWDIAPGVRDILKTRKLPYREVGAQALLDKTKLELRDVPELVNICDILFVAIQTPHEKRFEGVTRLPMARKEFDYDHVKAALASVAAAAKKQKKETIVALISTVLPGTTEREFKPLLPGTTEREFKPLLNKWVRLCYNPFFIAMGTTIPDFLNPEFVLLGVDCDAAADAVRSFYGTITDAHCRRMSVASAECTKVSYNTHITAKICLANSVGRLCHDTPGANCDDVMEALKRADRRIVSPAYMNVGMGDGGGCHPRDNIALSSVCRRNQWGYDPWNDLMTWRDGYASWLAELMLGTGLPCVILGYAFKPETNLTTGSPALLVESILQGCSVEVLRHDPNVIGNPIEDTTVAMLSQPHAYLIGCKHACFADYTFPKGSVVIDPHRYIPDQDGVTVVRIGENGPRYCE